MADVTGEIGGQQVQLNNAATEATLKQLLQATIAMAQKQGADLSAVTKLQKELGKLQKEAEKNSKIQGEVNKKKQDEAKQLEAAAAARKKEDEIREKSAAISKFARDKTQELGETMLAAGQKLTSMANSVANMGSSLSSAAGTFSHIPIVGGMLSGALGAVAGAAEKLQGSFRTASSVGANFGGSIRLMVDNATQAGLTFDQFASVIQKNGESLAIFGGNTTKGAERLSKMSKSLKDSGLQDELARLGMTSEDIANGMAQVSGRFARAGMTRGMKDEEIAAAAANYLKNLDAVSRLTGKNKEALQAEADARMADSQYRLMLAKLDPEGAANLEMLMASIPKEHQAGLKEILATGTATSEEAKAAMYYLNKTGQNAMALGQEMRNTGKLSREQVLQFDEAYKAETQAMAEQAKAGKGMISVVGNFGTDLQKNMSVGALNRAQQETLRKTTAEQTEEQKKLTEQQKKNKDALDPAAMVKAQQQVAEASNKMTTAMASQLPQLVTAIQGLTMVLDPLIKAFGFFMEHLYLIAGVAGSLVVAMKAINFARESMMKFRDFKNLGKERGSTPTNPMFVEDATGGGDIGKGKGKRGGKSGGGGGKSNFGKALGVVKGAGAVGAAVGVGMLASDLSNISDREKSGEITAEQAKEERGGAIGGAAGSAGGALAGAAAGAALGSVVPVIGTVVGGVIGGLLGGFGGTKLGESIGKGVAKSTTTGTVAGSSMDAEGFGMPETVEATPAATQASVRQVDNAIAATAAKPQGSGVNYNASPEQMLKQFAKSQGVTGTAKPIPTTTGQVQTVTDQMKADAEKKAAAEAKAKEDAAKKALEEGKPPAGAPTPPAQENPATMLATLNTTMTQLLKTNRELLSISEKQLSVQRQFTGDVFTV